MPEENVSSSSFIKYVYGGDNINFSDQQKEFIENLNWDYSKLDVEKIRSVERFFLNNNTGNLGSEFIPGLRDVPSQGCIYFSRIDNLHYLKSLKRIITHIPQNFPINDILKFYSPGVKITTPSKDILYPIIFHGDHLKDWKNRLIYSADIENVKLGFFFQGKFRCSDGSHYSINELDIEILRERKIPKNW